jgi:uncharacterized membrane protein YphA (DoxX/SURF4 family)
MKSRNREGNSKKTLLVGRIMSALAVLFLIFDGIGKLMKLPSVVEGTARLGYPEGAILGIGIIELTCVALYLIPRTAVLGSLFLVGYLGGAVATHVRIGDPLFSHILFPVYIALLIVVGLVLREKLLRTSPFAELEQTKIGRIENDKSRRGDLVPAFWFHRR